MYLHYLLIFRNSKQRYPNETSNRAYGGDMKGYVDIPVGGRDTMKTTDKAGIPHYVHDWSKHKPPHISSPTLLMENNDGCNLDNIHKLPYRDRSFSVGNKEIECHNLDFASATYATDNKTDSEHKTHVLWHATGNYRLVLTHNRVDIYKDLIQWTAFGVLNHWVIW